MKSRLERRCLPLSLGSSHFAQNPFLSPAFVTVTMYLVSLHVLRGAVGRISHLVLMSLMLLTKYKLYWDHYRALVPLYLPVYCF